MIEIYTSNNPNENPFIVTADDLRGYAESIADERCRQDESLDWSAIADEMERRFVTGEEEPDIDIHAEPTQ